MIFYVFIIVLKKQLMKLLDDIIFNYFIGDSISLIWKSVLETSGKGLVIQQRLTG